MPTHKVFIVIVCTNTQQPNTRTSTGTCTVYPPGPFPPIYTPTAIKIGAAASAASDPQQGAAFFDLLLRLDKLGWYSNSN